MNNNQKPGQLTSKKDNTRKSLNFRPIFLDRQSNTVTLAPKPGSIYLPAVPTRAHLSAECHNAIVNISLIERMCMSLATSLTSRLRSSEWESGNIAYYISPLYKSVVDLSWFHWHLRQPFFDLQTDVLLL